MGPCVIRLVRFYTGSVSVRVLWPSSWTPVAGSGLALSRSGLGHDRLGGLYRGGFHQAALHVIAFGSQEGVGHAAADNQRAHLSRRFSTTVILSLILAPPRMATYVGGHLHRPAQQLAERLGRGQRHTSGPEGTNPGAQPGSPSFVPLASSRVQCPLSRLPGRRSDRSWAGEYSHHRPAGAAAQVARESDPRRGSGSASG